MFPGVPVVPIPFKTETVRCLVIYFIFLVMLGWFIIATEIIFTLLKEIGAIRYVP